MRSVRTGSLKLIRVSAVGGLEKSRVKSKRPRETQRQNYKQSLPIANVPMRVLTL